MTSRLLSLLIWAAVAAAAVYWGLRLFVRPQPVPAQAVVASVAMPAGADLTRLLGAPPLQPPPDLAVPVADSRFRLLGVVAPRAGQASGLALVSVDGKPARALAVGRELEPGLRLLTVSQRQADFGVTRGAPTLTLSLPMLAEAARGRPGDAAQDGGAGAVPGSPPGMMLGGGARQGGLAPLRGGQFPGGQSAGGPSPGGPSPGGPSLRLPGGPGAVPRVMLPEVAPEVTLEMVNPATR